MVFEITVLTNPEDVHTRGFDPDTMRQTDREACIGLFMNLQLLTVDMYTWMFTMNGLSILISGRVRAPEWQSSLASPGWAHSITKSVA